MAGEDTRKNFGGFSQKILEQVKVRPAKRDTQDAFVNFFAKKQDKVILYFCFRNTVAFGLRKPREAVDKCSCARGKGDRTEEIWVEIPKFSTLSTGLSTGRMWRKGTEWVFCRLT